MNSKEIEDNIRLWTLNGRIAQWLEPQSYKLVVVGSIPAPPTKIK